MHVDKLLPKDESQPSSNCEEEQVVSRISETTRSARVESDTYSSATKEKEDDAETETKKEAADDAGRTRRHYTYRKNHENGGEKRNELVSSVLKRPQLRETNHGM
jgi:hypothetical protein